jgi:hypothetical protein
MAHDEIHQCRSCPWRVDCQPITDIPNYVPEMHHKLDRTICSGLETLFQKERHIMACHYSKPGEEFPCAGWLSNQLGPGNNLGVRLLVMTGKMPVPVVDGEQYETFEETLCNTPPSGACETSTASSTRSRKTGASTRTKPSAAKAAGHPSRSRTKRSRA